MGHFHIYLLQNWYIFLGSSLLTTTGLVLYRQVYREAKEYEEAIRSKRPGSVQRSDNLAIMDPFNTGVPNGYRFRGAIMIVMGTVGMIASIFGAPRHL